MLEFIATILAEAGETLGEFTNWKKSKCLMGIFIVFMVVVIFYFVTR